MAGADLVVRSDLRNGAPRGLCPRAVARFEEARGAQGPRALHLAGLRPMAERPAAPGTGAARLLGPGGVSRSALQSAGAGLVAGSTAVTGGALRAHAQPICH